MTKAAQQELTGRCRAWPSLSTSTAGWPNIPTSCRMFSQVRRATRWVAISSEDASVGRDPGWPTIIYCADWFGKGGPGSSITLQDMQGLMGVCRDLSGPSIDVLRRDPPLRPGPPPRTPDPGPHSPLAWLNTAYDFGKPLAQGVKIEDLEADQVLQDAELSVHHAAMQTSSGAAARRRVRRSPRRAGCPAPARSPASGTHHEDQAGQPGSQVP